MLIGCSGYNITMERAKISNSIFINGFYGVSVSKAKTPSGDKSLSEIIINSGFEKRIYENFSFNINLTSLNQYQVFENFSDTSNYLRINVGIKNRILNNLSLKSEVIYDIDLNLRPFKPYNQKYFYGILKLIYDYKNFSIITSLNSLSIIYNKSFVQGGINIYLRPDYNVPIFNIGFGFIR
ncbi:MAG: hypothetical protein ABIL78_04215 [candidate division WOR-3 bacterium]